MKANNKKKTKILNEQEIYKYSSDVDLLNAELKVKDAKNALASLKKE